MGLNLIKLVQTGSNLFKLDQIVSNASEKNLARNRDQKWQWVRIELISYILVRMVFKSDFFLPELALSAKICFSARIGFSTRNYFLDRNYFFLPEMYLWQKLLFSRKCFLAKNNFVKFEVAFLPEMAFWLEMAFCQIWLKRLTSIIEWFGSPLMVESFQACYYLKIYLLHWIHPQIFFVIFRPITVIPPPSAVSHIQKPVPPPRLHPDQQQLQQQHQMPTASPRRESLARTRTPSPKPSFFQVCIWI